MVESREYSCFYPQNGNRHAAAATEDTVKVLVTVHGVIVEIACPVVSWIPIRVDIIEWNLVVVTLLEIYYYS